jgi:hemerythrin-like domain-containing protein
MKNQLESYQQAWERREALRGDVDFTMMYVGHDAFARDLERLLTAVDQGTLDTPEARATWATFAEMLHLHHSIEDASLWPPLRAAVTAQEDQDLLDAMEAEHAGIDPRLEAIQNGFEIGDLDAVAENLLQLRTALRAHMVHEENEALPLLERTLGAEGWAAFGAAARKQGGMKAAATMLPWSLDGASPERAGALLALMPMPARLIYRWKWTPAYAKGARLH